MALALWAGGLSLLIETVQIFLPGRIVSLQDLVTNTLGALVGYWTWGVAARLARTWVHVGFARAAVTASLVWVATVLGLSAVDEWSARPVFVAGHVVAVGSRPRGDRAWCGRVENLVLTTGTLSFRDPDFAWEAGPNSRCDLTTAKVAPLPEALRDSLDSHGGLVSLDATPRLRDQRGPARILSIAHPGSREDRSLMVGQDGGSLEVRIRRPLTGREGRRPYFLIPDALDEGVPTSIRIELGADSLVIRAGEQSLVYRPALARDWWMYLVRVVRWRSAPLADSLAVAAFWILVCAPVGLLLGLARTPARGTYLLAGTCLALWGTALLATSLAAPGAFGMSMPLVALLAVCAAGRAMRGRLLEGRGDPSRSGPSGRSRRA